MGNLKVCVVIWGWQWLGSIATTKPEWAKERSGHGAFWGGGCPTGPVVFREIQLTHKEPAEGELKEHPSHLQSCCWHFPSAKNNHKPEHKGKIEVVHISFLCPGQGRGGG